jgi:hypothetical protein
LKFNLRHYSKVIVTLAKVDEQVWHQLDAIGMM